MKCTIRKTIAFCKCIETKGLRRIFFHVPTPFLPRTYTTISTNLHRSFHATTLYFHRPTPNFHEPTLFCHGPTPRSARGCAVGQGLWGVRTATDLHQLAMDLHRFPRTYTG